MNKLGREIPQGSTLIGRPEHRGLLSPQLKFNIAMRADAILQWAPRPRNPWNMVLNAVGLSSAAVGATTIFEDFSGRTAILKAAECKIGAFGMGFQYAKDPENRGNPFLIDPYSFHVPGLPDMGEAIITINQGPSPKIEIPKSMSPVDDHFETPFFSITAEPNAANGTAIQFDVALKDDLVIGPQTKEKPKKTFTAGCGKTGWFYVGRVAVADSIDSVIKGATGVNRIGYKIDQAMQKKLGKAPGATVLEKNDPVKNLESFKAQGAEIKEMSGAIKAVELQQGQKPEVPNPSSASPSPASPEPVTANEASGGFPVVPIAGGSAGLVILVGIGYGIAKKKGWI